MVYKKTHLLQNLSIITITYIRSADKEIRKKKEGIYEFHVIIRGMHVFTTSSYMMMPQFMQHLWICSKDFIELLRVRDPEDLWIVC